MKREKKNIYIYIGNGIVVWSRDVFRGLSFLSASGLADSVCYYRNLTAGGQSPTVKLFYFLALSHIYVQLALYRCQRA